FQRWPRQELLVDVVRAIRRFRPQVIVAVLPPDPRAGHGQHPAPGALAEEAMRVAGDPAAFPQLDAEGLPPWQPQVFLREAWWDPEHADIVLQTGVLDPWSGRSAFQLGVDARSQHRSQSQGALQSLDGRPVRLSRVSPPASAVAQQPDGEPARTDLFASVDTSLVALADLLPAGAAQGHVRVLLDDVRKQAEAARDALGPAHAGEVVAALAIALRELQEASHTVAGLQTPASGNRRHLAALLDEKEALAAQALADAAALTLDATTDHAEVVPGGSLAVAARLWNGGASTVRVRALTLVSPAAWSADVPVPLAEHAAAAPGAGVPAATNPANAAGVGVPGTNAGGRADAAESGASATGPVELPGGALLSLPATVTVDPAAVPTVPYFLTHPRNGDLYDWSDVPAAVRGEPFQPPPLVLRAELELVPPEQAIDVPAGTPAIDEKRMTGAPSGIRFTLEREVVAAT